MTEGKVREVVGIYLKKLKKLGVIGKTLKKTRKTHHQRDLLMHARNILENIETCLRMGKLKKAIQALGRVQGIFLACGIYSISEMHEHNGE